jgi:hypothetical protein
MGSFGKLFGKTCGLQLPCERIHCKPRTHGLPTRPSLLNRNLRFGFLIRAIVCFSCPGHNEFVTRAGPSRKLNLVALWRISRTQFAGGKDSRRGLAQTVTMLS